GHLPPRHPAADHAGGAVLALDRDDPVVRRADRLAVRELGARAAGGGADVVEPFRRLRSDDRRHRFGMFPVRAPGDDGRSGAAPRAQLADRLMPSAVLELAGVRKRYDSLVAVDDLHLTLEAGEFLTLLGPSGSGKTTTLM